MTRQIELSKVLAPEELDKLDLFDAMQLKSVLGVCKGSKSISDAGRKLYAASRSVKEKPNDSDRLKKYLAKFGLSWNTLFLE
jgi:transcriptional regulatory protein RtcR